MTTIFITGGHSGIGLEAARQLAAKHNNLVLAGRSPEVMERVATELRSAHGVTITTVALDLASLVSVRAAATEVNALLQRGSIEPLSAVLCNAGGRFDGDVSFSPEGYEKTFATNCLGHFLLIELLLPTLPSHARIVFTASGTHDPDSVDGKMVGAAVEPDALSLANQGKDGAPVLSAGKRYSTSKLVTVMTAYELDRRLRRSGSSVSSIAYDPGAVPETGFLRGMPRPVQWLATSRLMKFVSKRIGITVSDVQFSGGSLAALAVDAQYAEVSGKYFQAYDGALSAVKSARWSYDEARASQLWDVQKQLVHLGAHEEPAQLR